MPTQTVNLTITYDQTKNRAQPSQWDWHGLLDLAPGECVSVAHQEAPQNIPLKVDCLPMPESNGKSNWTVMLRRVNPKGLIGGMTNGLCIYRSEYTDRARYHADSIRYMIGLTEDRPHILDYDGDLKVDVHQAQADQAIPTQISPEEKILAMFNLGDDRIKEIMLENGFSIKEGRDDLKPYVYAAVHAIQREIAKNIVSNDFLSEI